MKFRDLDGQFKDIVIKTGDTLPVGSVVEYEGSTPPAGWSKLSDGGSVIVSSEEPTTGEEVWIQRGENLFNPDTDIEFTDGYRSWNGTGEKVTDNTFYGLKIQVEPNKTYVTVSSVPYTHYHNLCFFDSQMGFISSDAYNTSNKTFTTPENCSYVTMALPKTYTWFELEEGSSITPKKIYTKNINGVYEEFYNEAKLEIYSTEEKRVGTWINNKPIYRKVITGSLTGIGNDWTNIATINNVDETINLNGIISNTLTDGRSFNLNTYESSSYSSSFCYVKSGSNGTNQIQAKVTGWNSASFGFVFKLYFEYTKTTD